VFQDRFSNFNLRKPVSRFTAAIRNLKKRIPNQNPEMQSLKSEFEADALDSKTEKPHLQFSFSIATLEIRISDLHPRFLDAKSDFQGKVLNSSL
jgi:hypothetical protein